MPNEPETNGSENLAETLQGKEPLELLTLVVSELNEAEWMGQEAQDREPPGPPSVNTASRFTHRGQYLVGVYVSGVFGSCGVEAASLSLAILGILQELAELLEQDGLQPLAEAVAEVLTEGP